MNFGIQPGATPATQKPRRQAHNGLLPKRRLTSKISNLPAEIRNQINQSIFDGVLYADILRALVAAGHPHINRNNLTRWYRSGYQDWLAEYQRTQDSRTRTEAALGTLRRLQLAGKGDLADANDLLLANQLHEILRDFDASTVKDQIAEKPENFFRLAGAIIDQTNDRTVRHRLQLEFEKYRNHVARQKELMETAAKQTDPEGGLPPEIVRQLQIAIAGL